MLRARKDYTDNWLSEAHEQFCGLEYADWKELLADTGFEVDGLDWPVTHVLLVARRPLNT